MVDIVPAALLTEVSKDSVQESKAYYNEFVPDSDASTSDSSGIEIMPETGSEDPKRNKGAWYSFAAVILVVVIGVIIIFINRDNVSRVFVGDGNTASTEQLSYISIDEDNDGLTTLEELASGTLVFDPDTDKDGIPDGYEVRNGLNPLSPLDASDDKDGDELNNADEYFYESDINDPDTDKDGFKDGAEVKRNFNPNGAGELVKKQSTEPTEPVFDDSVSITSETFDPQFIRIEIGDSLTFVNNDSISHSITGPEIETGNILPGKSFTLEFQNEGTYSFFDRDNAIYSGKIIVEKGTEI